MNSEPAKAKTEVILASSSSRRKALLEQVGYAVEAYPVNVDETAAVGETPSDLVVRLARVKALACRDRIVWDHHKPIIGADTVIDLDGCIIGKPTSRQDGIATLMRLADREHCVRTGVCVMDANTLRPLTRLTNSIVRFGPISLKQAEAYWDSGEPADKAGGYAIQGLGAQFVSHLSGSYSSVVGLPLYETIDMLNSASNERAKFNEILVNDESTDK